MVLLLIITFLFVLVFVFLMRKMYYAQLVLTEFRGGNVIVFGRKGKGKDLLFQWVINARKRACYSNIYYGGRSMLFNLKNLDCGQNTYENVLSGNIIKFKPQFNENTDFYVSEGGIQLPCQYNHILNKQYKSLPLIYALSRHIYNANIHCNMQGVGRIWNLLREQADSFIWVRGRIKLPFIIIIKGTIYKNEQEARSERRPLKQRFLRRTEIDIYNHEQGQPRDFWVILSKRKIYYDTRYFKSVFCTD